MIAFFESVIGLLNNFWEIVTNFFSTLAHALVMVNTSLALPVRLLGYLPTVLGSAMMVFIGVYVVKFMLGR